MPLLNPGDHFPPITITPVDGEAIDLPDALAGHFAVLMTGIAPDRHHAWYRLFLTMAGFGLWLVPSTIVAAHGPLAGKSGLGSALINTSRLSGGALGPAILVTITHAAGHDTRAGS
ncbi:MAG: hypothetical protein JOY89_23995, partial [Solirubrobacterales bacterium]|nr:hypothetical protein [Solirubrobacterales bacterium]